MHLDIILTDLPELAIKFLTSPPPNSQQLCLTHHQLLLTAAKKAIEMSGISPSDIHLVICATSSPDDLFGDAPSIASAVGCTTRTVAFDLTAACSGFLFGIVTAGMYLENG